jgi:Zn-dependent protease
MIGSASLRLGKIKSIEININITWLVIFALLVYWLRTGYIAENAPHLSSTLAWIVSGLGAAVLFCSVLIHELSHSLVAIRNGLPIRRITLFIFGGVAQMEEEPRTPGVEFRMALAGPLASLVIAAISGVARFILLKGSPESIAAVILEYAFYANTVLACFNLVPGYPLDGGRIFRALLWKVTRNFVRSTVIAATVGRVFGLFMVFVGVTISVAYEMPALLWPALVGTFLERLAYLSALRVRLQGPVKAADRHGYSSASFTPPPEYYRSDGEWRGSRGDSKRS